MREFHHHGLYDQKEPYLIDLPDNLQVMGTLRGRISPDLPLCLLTHGSLGYGDDLIQYNAARALSAAGIASLRLSVFGGAADNLRNRLEVTQQDYADDVTTVTDHLRNQGISKLFGAGHSAGGLALLMASPKVQLDAMVLWDPSHGLLWEKYKGLSDGEEIMGDLIVQRKGDAHVRSKRQVDFEHNMGDTTHCAANKQNLLIISAGQGELTDYGKQYIDAALEPKKHIILPEAGHCFTEGETLQELLGLTATWFRQQIQ
jgi:dienelactone hydrolase